MADKNFKVKSGLQVPSLTTAGPVVTDNAGNVTSSATLPISQGGTGQTTAGNALNALLPLQTSQDNKYLQTNGVSTQWTTVLQPIYSANAPSNPITGQIWVESDVDVTTFDQNLIRRKTITATAGQTVFTADYAFVDAYEQVFLNGILLVRASDYTTNGATNTVTLIQGASAGDILEIVSITNLNTINAATTTTNTFTGTQTIANSGEWPVRIVSTGATSSNRAHFISQRSNNGGAVPSGFTLGGLSMAGHDGTNYSLGWNGGAEITAYASQTWTPSARGTDLVFSTSYANQTSPSERFRIAANDTFGFNVASPSYGIHHRVFGNAEIATQYGTGLATYIGAYAAEGSLRVTGANPLTFYNNSSERMRISSDGNVNIGGASNPGDTLRFFDIYNVNSGNSAGSIIRLITNNIANNGLTTVDIVKYRTGDFYIVNNEGPIRFGSNGVDRMRILSTGAVLVNTSTLLNNEMFGIKNTGNVQTLWLDQTDANFTTVAQAIRTTRTNNSAYTYFITYSNNGGDTEHYLRGDGQAYADGSWNGGGADYAEYFEWADGNPDNENRLGYAVSLINDKIKIAEEGETPIGVVSGNPSVVGDHASNKWSGKYLKNDFGVYLRDENGDRIINPEFDPEVEYVSREDRPEWSMVGLMGKLRLRKGQVIGTGWIKMRDISETVEEWLIK